MRYFEIFWDGFFECMGKGTALAVIGYGAWSYVKYQGWL